MRGTGEKFSVIEVTTHTRAHTQTHTKWRQVINCAHLTALKGQMVRALEREEAKHGKR